MQQITRIIQASIDCKLLLLNNKNLLQTIFSVVEIMVAAFKNGKRIYFCGNGGSAADAQHLAAEFSGRFYMNRKALPAEALHCNASYITAAANDFGYDVVYARLIDGIGTDGDVLIGLSTSGNSVNIVKAFEAAQAKKITTIGFTGAANSLLDGVSDYLIKIPSTDTPRIQESHMLI